MKKHRRVRQKRTRIHHEGEMKQVTITVYTYPNNRCRLLEIPDERAEPLTGNNKPLSLEEFDKLADELADKFMEFVGPDAQPLSDYAMSREGIYEDHP